MLGQNLNEILLILFILLELFGFSSCSPQLAAVSQQQLEKLLNIRTAAGNSSILVNSPANDLLLNSSSNSSQPNLVFGEWRLQQLLPVGGSVAADAVQLQPWLGSSKGSLRSFGVDLSGFSEQFDLLIGDGGLGGSFSIGIKYFVTFAACSQTRCSIASAVTSFTIQDLSSDAASADAATVVPVFISAASALFMIILVIFDVFKYNIRPNNQVENYCGSEANAAENQNQGVYTIEANAAENQNQGVYTMPENAESSQETRNRHPPPYADARPSFLAAGR